MKNALKYLSKIWSQLIKLCMSYGQFTDLLLPRFICITRPFLHISDATERSRSIYFIGTKNVKISKINILIKHNKLCVHFLHIHTFRCSTLLDDLMMSNREEINAKYNQNYLRRSFMSEYML